jgi:pyridoxine kinase
MLNEPYNDGPYTEDYIKGLMERLSGLLTSDSKTVILTGVSFEGNNNDELGAAYYTKDSFGYTLTKRIDGYYHGTGDVFSSVVLAALLNGLDENKAVELAVHFTADSIQRTFDSKSDIRFGVNFEAGLAKLGLDVGVI